MRQHKLFWGSSYDRGLQHLLKMWPKIKETYPDTTLNICYGWGLFEQRYANNPERMQWKDNMDKLMTQDGITHYGRIGKDELNQITKNCGIWVYPTDFDEINCITALNCQSLGCVPCVINKAALEETVGAGIKVNGDIYDPDTREEFLKKLLELMGDKKLYEAELEKGIKFASSYSWDKISNQWIKEFMAQ
jgi:glycosyltransferase involved in cell wall biosynthesis